jgi:hypothetical protein
MTFDEQPSLLCLVHLAERKRQLLPLQAVAERAGWVHDVAIISRGGVRSHTGGFVRPCLNFLSFSKSFQASPARANLLHTFPAAAAARFRRRSPTFFFLSCVVVF